MKCNPYAIQGHAMTFNDDWKPILIFGIADDVAKQVQLAGVFPDLTSDHICASAKDWISISIWKEFCSESFQLQWKIMNYIIDFCRTDTEKCTKVYLF